MDKSYKSYKSYTRKLQTKVTEQEAFRGPWDGVKVTGVFLYVRCLKIPPGGIRRAHGYGLGTTGPPADGGGEARWPKWAKKLRKLQKLQIGNDLEGPRALRKLRVPVST